jgi:hypothetical protein
MQPQKHESPKYGIAVKKLIGIWKLLPAEISYLISKSLLKVIENTVISTSALTKHRIGFVRTWLVWTTNREPCSLPLLRSFKQVELIHPC